MPLDLNSLDDAEKFTQHFVSPLVNAVRLELGPLVKRVELLEAQAPALSDRVKTLEGYAKRLGTVYSGVIAAVTFLVHWGWAKVQHKFFS